MKKKSDHTEVLMLLLCWTKIQLHFVSFAIFFLMIFHPSDSFVLNSTTEPFYLFGFRFFFGVSLHFIHIQNTFSLDLQPNECNIKPFEEATQEPAFRIFLYCSSANFLLVWDMKKKPYPFVHIKEEKKRYIILSILFLCRFMEKIKTMKYFTQRILWASFEIKCFWIFLVAVSHLKWFHWEFALSNIFYWYLMADRKVSDRQLIRLERT